MTNDFSTIRNGLRILVRGTRAVWCVLACLAEYCARVITGRLDPVQRAAVLQKWSARLLAGIKVSISVDGPVPEHGLIVSNHLSYLDILVFSVICGCVFVAKREIKSWPGVGWVASLAGTIYVDRARRTDTHSIQPEMQSALSRGLCLVLFPEGTSSNGSSVLRFHSSLFQPALDLSAHITAAAIDYRILPGDAATEACYWGDMTLLPHVLNILTKDSIEAGVKFSAEHLQFTNRKRAAATMQLKVESLREVSAGAH